MAAQSYSLSSDGYDVLAWLDLRCPAPGQIRHGAKEKIHHRASSGFGVEKWREGQVGLFPLVFCAEQTISAADIGEDRRESV